MIYYVRMQVTQLKLSNYYTHCRFDGNFKLALIILMISSVVLVVIILGFSVRELVLCVCFY